MLKIDEEALNKMDIQHRGIVKDIRQFEEAELPSCPQCGSQDTADVQCGMVGRKIYIATATTKYKLVPNPPKPGNYFCNACEKFFM